MGEALLIIGFLLVLLDFLGCGAALYEGGSCSIANIPSHPISFTITLLLFIIGATLYVYDRHRHGTPENMAARENLVNKLVSDAQYEDAFKEWWLKLNPERRYERETFVHMTKEYVDSGMITLQNDDVKFGGAAKLVGKLYLMKKDVVVPKQSQNNHTSSHQ
jgi:hypothetical protein